MAITKWFGGIGSNAPSAINAIVLQSMNATNNGTSVIFYPWTTDPITHVFLRYGVRTGTPPTYIAAIEGVDGNGNPDGVVKGGGTPASVTFTPPADTTWNTTGRWLALANSFAPADLSTPLSITFRYSSGTVDGSNFSSIGRTLANNGPATQIPYSNNLTAAAWSRASAGPVFGFKTASAIFGSPFVISYATTTGTNGHRHCLKWAPSADWGTAIEVIGLSVPVSRHGSVNGSYKIGIWNDAGTELRSTGTLDTDISSSSTNSGTITAVLTSPYTLTPGTTYYFGYENMSSQTMGINGPVFSDAADREVLAYGTSKSLATWNGSAWTEDTTCVPLVDLICNAITFPSGGGGGSLINNSSLVRGFVL